MSRTTKGAAPVKGRRLGRAMRLLLDSDATRRPSGKRQSRRTKGPRRCGGAPSSAPRCSRASGLPSRVAGRGRRHPRSCRPTTAAALAGHDVVRNRPVRSTGAVVGRDLSIGPVAVECPLHGGRVDGDLLPVLLALEAGAVCVDARELLRLRGGAVAPLALIEGRCDGRPRFLHVKRS